MSSRAIFKIYFAELYAVAAEFILFVNKNKFKSQIVYVNCEVII